MNNFLSVETVFFTILGYPMSYIEFVGTILYLWSVWLIARRNRLTWPVGIVSVLLFMALFYQIRLYSDALEQVYYLGASLYGWWYWTRGGTPAGGGLVDVGFSPPRALLAWVGVTVVGSLLLGGAMSRIHRWLPGIFPAAADFPYLDALTTVMSFVAMWLLARKHTESWIYWIIVDVIGIGLYYVKEVRFIALLYVFLLGLATKGLIDWTRASAAPSTPSSARGSPG